MVFSLILKNSSALLSGGFPSQNHNSKPGGALWKMSGDLGKTLFSSLLTSFIEIWFRLALS